MALTPIGTATPYCTVSRLFQFHDWHQVADMVRDGEGARPTRQCLLDSTSVEGALLVRLLLAVSGELESACLVGDRYSPEDLQALTNSGLARLEKLTADLCFWGLSQRRQPNAADPRTVPGALLALQELDRLRTGERIFGFQEAADAGLPSVSDPDPTQFQNGSGAILGASRLFGSHGHGGYR